MRKSLLSFILLFLLTGKLFAQQVPAGYQGTSMLSFRSISSNGIALTICVPRTGLEGFYMDSLRIALPPNGVQLIPIEAGKGVFIFISTMGETTPLWIGTDWEHSFQIMQQPGSSHIDIMSDGPSSREKIIVDEILNRGKTLFPLLSNTGFPQGLSFKSYTAKADSVYKIRKKILEEAAPSFGPQSYRDLEQWLYYRNIEMKLRWKMQPEATAKVKKRKVKFAKKLSAQAENDSFYRYMPAIQALGLYHSLYMKPQPGAKISTVTDMKKWKAIDKKLDGKALEMTHAWYILYLADRRNQEQNKALLELYLKEHPRSLYYPFIQQKITSRPN